MQPLIEINNLTVIKSTESVLDSVDFDVYPGDYICIFGPNGAGKSTCIKCILGLEVYTGSIEKKQNINVGYVPQKPEFISKNFPATTEEIVASGKEHAQYKEIEQAMDTFGISHLKGKQFNQLSGGQKQLVMASRSIVGNPDVLILDEPLAGVDITNSGTYYSILKKINAAGTAIVMVTHELDVIKNEASKVVWLNKSLVFVGNTTDFLHLAHEAHLDEHGH